MNEAGQHPVPPDDSTAALLEPDGIELDLKEGSFWAMDEVSADVRITCAHLLNAVEDQVNLYNAEGNRGPPEFSYWKNCITSLPIGIPLELSKSEDSSLLGNNLAVAVAPSDPFVSLKECSLESSAASADANVMNSSVSSVGETIESVIAKYAQKSLTRSRFGRVRKRRCISPSPVIPVKKSKVQKLKKCQSSLVDPPKRQPSSCSKMQRKRFPGEIVWFKVLGQPFWPGMVTRDSISGEYVRRKAGISEYHVTPFGHNKSEKWILAPQVMKFQGKQRFEEHVRDLLTRFPEDSVKQSVVKGRFIMSSPKRKEWEEVVHEVETSHAFNDLLPVPEPPLIDSPPRSQKKEKRKRKLEVLSESKMPSSMTVSTEPVIPLKSNFDKSHAKCPSLNFNLLNTAKDEKQTHSHMKAKLIRSKTRKPRKNALNGAADDDKELTDAVMLKRHSLKKFLKDIPAPTECSEVTTTSSLAAKKLGDSDLTLNSSNQSAFSGKKLGTSESKSEKVCQVCEMIIAAVEGGVKCIGGCNSTFHITCANPLPVLPLTGDYKCEECNSGVHKCFVCKDSEGMTRRCNIRLCGKFYHHSCITSYKHARVDGNSYICSLHVCLTCFRNKSAVRGNGGRLYRCLRCPVAYHSGEDCLAAGSYIISNSTIICPAHYEPPKQLPHKKVKHVNVNWCFVCSTGGSLICCESCPASFHAECLGIEPPEGSYYCAECLSGIELMYGDIVWAKMGAYRWWPAKIINPRNVPVNIRNIPHQAGEFPVCFFGTHDYNWTCRSRVFQFLEGDQGAHGNHSNRLARLYDKALDEASVAYQEWKIAKECRAAQDYERNNLKPPPYKHIKANKPVGKVTLNTADPSQMTPCDCDPNSENPCGSDSDCLNRMLMFECHPAVCAAGERCQNQRFEKRQYVPAEPFKVEGKGWGLKCLVDVKKGQFVNEYLGELIDEEECRRRMVKMHEDNNTNYYFLTIDKDRIIDAGRKGNLSRFMNHSCQPNCETHKWTVNGNTRVGLFAVRDIPIGTELTFNYNLDCLGNEKTTCRCEAPNCSGFIGDRPKKSDKVCKLKKKKKKSRTFKSMHEDICFRCGKDGELLMCDRKNCCKAYHLPCLKLDKRPHGRWDCPWHHCDICGKAASSLCTSCPNSFCKEHSCNNVQLLPDGTVYCNDHMKTDVSPVTISSTAHQNCVSPTATPATETKVLTEEEIAILNMQKQRQRMIAEKLKIKLNGAALYNKVPRKSKVQGKHIPLKNKSAKEDKGSTLTTKGSRKKSTKCSKRSHRKSVIKFQTTPLPNGTALDVHIHKKHSNDKDYHLCRTSKDVHQKSDLKKVITLKISKYKVDTDNTAMERSDAGSRARKTVFNGVLNGEKVAKVQTKKKHRKTASKLNGEVKDGIRHPSRKMNGTLVAKKKKKKKKRKRTSSHKVPSELMSQVNNSTEAPMGMIIQTDQHETLDEEKESLTRASKSFVPDTFAQLSLPNSISSV